MNRQRLRLTVPIATFLPLLTTLNHALRTGFGSHHLCGAGYDDYLPYGSELLARWYYPSMWILALTLSFLATLPWLLRRQRTLTGRAP